MLLTLHYWSELVVILFLMEFSELFIYKTFLLRSKGIWDEPYAKQYASITLIECRFIVTNGMSNLIRADGKPKYSMVCMVVGAIINTILDPIFYFVFDWGIAGAAWANSYWANFSFILSHLLSMAYFLNNPFLKKSRFYWTSKYENLQHGNQQQLKPDCSYRDSNHSVQFVDLLRRINKIWNR